MRKAILFAWFAIHHLRVNFFLSAVYFINTRKLLILFIMKFKIKNFLFIDSFAFLHKDRGKLRRRKEWGSMREREKGKRESRG